MNKELQKLLLPYKDLPPAAVIYSVAALSLMLIYLLQGNRDFFVLNLAPLFRSGTPMAEVEWWSVLYQFFAAFLLFLVIPALFLKYLGKEKLTRLGLGLGDVRYGMVVSIIGIFFLSIPAGLTAGSMPGFSEEYPLAKLSMESSWRLLVYQLAYGLLYYVAWESFFRGLLQFGLSKYIGDFSAILVQTACSTLMHIGKPPNEIWAAMLAGFVFGTVVLRTRSVWPLVAIHWVLGFLTDVSSARVAGIW
jgi:membrane protease YdiL (CAAX protease family)